MCCPNPDTHVHCTLLGCHEACANPLPHIFCHFATCLFAKWKGYHPGEIVLFWCSNLCGCYDYPDTYPVVGRRDKWGLLHDKDEECAGCLARVSHAGVHFDAQGRICERERDRTGNLVKENGKAKWVPDPNNVFFGQDRDRSKHEGWTAQPPLVPLMQYPEPVAGAGRVCKRERDSNGELVRENGKVKWVPDPNNACFGQDHAADQGWATQPPLVPLMGYPGPVATSGRGKKAPRKGHGGGHAGRSATSTSRRTRAA